MHNILYNLYPLHPAGLHPQGQSNESLSGASKRTGVHSSLYNSAPPNKHSYTQEINFAKKTKKQNRALHDEKP